MRNQFNKVFLHKVTFKMHENVFRMEERKLSISDNVYVACRIVEYTQTIDLPCKNANLVCFPGVDRIILWSWAVDFATSSFYIMSSLSILIDQKRGHMYMQIDEIRDVTDPLWPSLTEYCQIMRKVYLYTVDYGEAKSYFSICKIFCNMHYSKTMSTFLRKIVTGLLSVAYLIQLAKFDKINYACVLRF